MKERDDRPVSAPPNSFRILLLNDNLRGVGSFYRCWHLARELVRLGHEVCLVTVSRDRRFVPRTELIDGIKLIESPNLLDLVYGLGPGYGIVGIPYRIVATARDPFDVVHTFESRPNVVVPAMIRRALDGSPLVVDWADWYGFTRDGSGLHERRRWPVPQWENAFEEFTHRRADWVTTISSGLRDRALAVGVSADRIRWIPSGAPADTIRALDIVPCRRELDVPPETYLIGFVGSQVGDLEIVAPALRILHKTHPRAKLGIIGPPMSDMRAPGFRDAIIPFGPVPHARLSLYLGACNAFVLPLRDTVFNRTRWPNKFGDYLAAGRPILCSDVGDVAPIVQAEGCGVVWKDLSDLVEGVERLIDDDESADSMGRAARRVAEGRLSWRAITLEFLKLYRDAAS